MPCSHQYLFYPWSKYFLECPFCYQEREQEKRMAEVRENLRTYAFLHLDHSTPKDKITNLKFLDVPVDTSWPVDKLIQLIALLTKRTTFGHTVRMTEPL
jgi:hypothetical protein